MELSRDKIKEIINDDWLLMDDCEGNKNCDVVKELARIALASLEAEPVEWRVVFKLDGQPGSDFEKTFKNQARMNEVISLHERAGFCASITPLYAAPPAPASVPAAMEMDDDFDSAFEHGKAVGWNAYRAAMLQSFGNSEQLNSPVIPDGWVPVSERMPDEYNFDIWVFSPSIGVQDGVQWDGLEFADDEYQFRIKDVSHWMKKIYPAAPLQEVK